jgi:hypothetical protein
MTLFAVCLLSGCSVFSMPVGQAARNSANLSLATERQWCLVEMPETKLSGSRSHLEYIGQVHQVSEDSVTLSNATTRIQSEPQFRRTRSVKRLYIETRGKILPGLPTQVTLSREDISRIVLLNPETAARLKKSVEPIGVDFDFDIPHDQSDVEHVQRVGIDFF